MPESTEGRRDLAERAFAFAVRIIRLCKKLQEKPGVLLTIGQQLLKSGTAIGANYEEGQAGQSRADFLSKTSIALKEARETRYWLRLLVSSELLPPELLHDLLDEAEQITKILGSIVCRTKERK